MENHLTDVVVNYDSFQATEPVVIAVETGFSIEDHLTDVVVCAETPATGSFTSIEPVVFPDGMKFDQSLVGCKALEWEQLEDVYRKHCNLLGFSFKRATSRLYRSGKIKEKYLLCSCEGFAQIKPLGVITPSPPTAEQMQQAGGLKRKRRHRNLPLTRSGCKACLIITHNKEDELYFVKEHEIYHNHPLTRPEWQHFHRVERRITKEKGQIIEVMEAAGLKPSDGFRFMSHAAGGEEHVGHTKKDHINYVTQLRMQSIAGNDAQNVINSLHRLKQENPEFYFNYLLDDDGKLACIFWRDAMMKWDYKLFGDVVVFDTTYRTNKYNLICAPFVGINNHWSTVMFGCAFLTNETTKSFVWLFNEFLEAMDNKKPITIFTDQDAAIAAAIKKVFGEETRHRLCLWHISQNAYNNFGEMKKNEEMKAAFSHCLSGCRSEEEFESSWQAMIEKYNLQDHSWFQKLYDAREKWCTGLSTDIFSAGMLSSQRSESTNHAISFKSNKTTTLTQFFQIFNSTIDGWRSTEKHNEFKSSRSNPKMKSFNKIVKHAGEVYTPAIFKYFQREFFLSIGTLAVEVAKIGDIVQYFVTREDEEGRVYKVNFCEANDVVTVTCSCKHFEEVGWLCMHCIRILHLKNVTAIPDAYIVKRWTKMAKLEVWDSLSKQQTSHSALADTIAWRHHMIRAYTNMVMQSEGDINARRVLEDGARRDSLNIQQLVKAPEQCTVHVTGSAPTTSQSSSAPVLDPDRAKTKGRSARIKGKFDRTQPIPAEIFSRAPNERLF